MDIKELPTGDTTPWPNRAETAVRLFKKQFNLLVRSVMNEPDLLNPHVPGRGRQLKITVKHLCRVACWARNNQLMVGGKTPLELAYGRKPPPIFDVETATPEQLSQEPPVRRNHSSCSQLESPKQLF